MGITKLVQARTKDGQIPIDRLLWLAENATKEADQIEATRILLAYGWGKPAETVVNVDLTAASNLSLEPSELTSIARQFLNPISAAKVVGSGVTVEEQAPKPSPLLPEVVPE